MQPSSGRPIGARFVMLAAVFVVCAGLAACRTDSPVVTINILGDRGNHSYDPGNITVDWGAQITWINRDSQPHSVTSPGAFDSGMIAPNGGRWTWVAHMEGTYTYSSLSNPGMSGTITVLGRPPNPQ